MEIKAQVTKCPQGHYYNAAVHAACPYCNSGASASPSELPKTGSLGPGEAPNSAFPPTEAPGGGAFPHTIAPEGYSAQGGGYPGGVTIPVSNYHNVGGPVDPFSVPTMIGGMEVSDNQPAPVVGWLVCIDGPVRGTDFRLHAGYNYIGREIGDIHIHGDRQISRENHAMIAFDNSELTYYVGPATGRNLIKVNGKTVFNAVELHSYDVISIGTTKLLFIGLCGERFQWEERHD